MDVCRMGFILHVCDPERKQRFAADMISAVKETRWMERRKRG